MSDTAKNWPPGMPDEYKVEPVGIISFSEAMERRFWATICEMTDEMGVVQRPEFVARPRLTIKDGSCASGTVH